MSIATSYFARVDVSRVKEELADLETLTERDATEADFIDLGEVNAFSPEVMDGECSA